MGLISGLLLLPVVGPAKGLLFILDQIKEWVNAEQLDESLIEDGLVVLSLQRELGEISDADYLAQEAALLERLNAIRLYKESLDEQNSASEGES